MGLNRFFRVICKAKLVGLDTSCFIYHFGKKDPYHFLTLALFKEVEKTLVAITSIVSFIEVIALPFLDEQPELIGDYRRFFTGQKNLVLCDLNLNIGEKTGFLRRRYRLKTPDAIQLATAIEENCGLFITNDEMFRKIKEIPILLLKDFVR